MKLLHSNRFTRKMHGYLKVKVRINTITRVIEIKYCNLCDAEILRAFLCLRPILENFYKIKKIQIIKEIL